MKNLLAVTGFMILTALSFAGTTPCDSKAEAILKNVVKTTIGQQVANEAQYNIQESKVKGNTATVVMDAFGLNGEDSDTYMRYEFIFNLGVLSGKCDTLQSIKLVGEN